MPGSKLSHRYSLAFSSLALVHGFTNLAAKKICELIRNGMTFGVLSFLYLPSCDVCCAASLIITYHILCVLVNFSEIPNILQLLHGYITLFFFFFLTYYFLTHLELPNRHVLQVLHVDKIVQQSARRMGEHVSRIMKFE